MSNKKAFFIIKSSKDLKKVSLSENDDTIFDNFGKVDTLLVGDLFTTKLQKEPRSGLYDAVDKNIENKIKKYYNFIFIKSLSAFIKYFEERKGSVALAAFSDTWHNWYILVLAKKYNIYLIRRRTKSAGLLLYTKEKKIIERFFNISIFKVILYRIFLFLIKIKLFQKIDTVFISDDKTYQKHMNHPQYKNLVRVNSYHYDNFVKNNYAPSKDYIVFVDSNAVYHPDAKKYTDKQIEAKFFFIKLNKLFDIFEEILEKEVIVCAHPLYDMNNAPIDYPNRKVYNNRSEEFIAKAELVLYNFSTMINFAILYDKPMIQLCADDFTGLWKDHCNNIQEYFHHPVIHFYNAKKQDAEEALEIWKKNCLNYLELNRRYINDNLAFSHKERKTSGDIMAERIKEILLGNNEDLK